MRRIMRDHSGKITLIVTRRRRDRAADRRAARQQAPDPRSAPTDFGELYIVTIPYYGKVKTLRFHYGDPPSRSAHCRKGRATTFSAAPPSP